MSVLEKASELIDCLGQAGEPVSLAFVRSALDMPKSSTHRLLGELAGLGIVRRTEDGRYSLGPRLLYWGEAAAETFDLRAVAEPAMRRLRDEVGESVHLYLRDGDTRMCIAAVEARHELRPFIQLGRPLPLRAGAAGKLLLAFADEETQRLELRRAKTRRGRRIPNAPGADGSPTSSSRSARSAGRPPSASARTAWPRRRPRSSTRAGASSRRCASRVRRPACRRSASTACARPLEAERRRDQPRCCAEAEP